MTEKDFEIVCSTIDEEKEILNSISQDIWKMPELQFKEVHAHAVLTSALTKYGFKVEKHYFLTTAFKAEYNSKLVGGPTIAILLEYDALPDIGHACGHNLIAEAGLAAAMAVKKVMEQDPRLTGKLIVLGSPAEEGGGGKIRLIELGAFDGVDAALMAHPTKVSLSAPVMSGRLKCWVEFKGKESHAAAYPWEAKNALDAAVACYNNIALLRQQIKPHARIHVIITEGGLATNIIPAKSKMELAVRDIKLGDLKQLQSRVEACINGAANATGCIVCYRFDESNCYQNLLTNEVLKTEYENYSKKLGVTFEKGEIKNCGSSDMGNVSHVLPSIHPFYAIPAESGNHTKGFTEAAGSPEAQEPTLTTAKALAMTCLSMMRNPEKVDEVKGQFLIDINEDMNA